MISETLVIRRAGVGPPVPLLLDPHNVAGAPVRDQQVGAVFGREEIAQRVDLGEQADQVVVMAGREHCADQIVAHALGAQVHLQAVGEEIEQII